MEKSWALLEAWECELWSLYDTTNIVKQHIRENFPYRQPVAAKHYSERIQNGILFTYLQCDIEVPESRRAIFANFFPFIKNVLICYKDKRDLINNSAEKKDFLLEIGNCWFLAPRYKTVHWTLLSFLFYFELGLFQAKIHCLLKYTAENSSTVLCSKQQTQEWKVTRTIYQVRPQGRWS